MSHEEGPAVVVSLEDEVAARAEIAGGKGANLARLVAAGFPVPPGFCVTTRAYQEILDATGIREAIASLDEVDRSDLDALRTQASRIREAIRQAPLPNPVREALQARTGALNAASVSVRSSATAEDLPTASFAGQHETFLGVEPEDVPNRVRDCLASLFTDRAVAYRAKHGIPHTDVAMAVVVQEMIDPDVAGVLFTADPVSGNRHIASIDANYGLGDTVVAGDVSPDNARIDRRTGEVLEYDVGTKTHALRAGAGPGGPERTELTEDERAARVLTDDEVRRLAQLADRIEALFGSPQDVEWALVDGDLVVLQSRPITSLFPLPEPTPDDDRLHVYFSLGHQQAMPEALPPLVLDWVRRIAENTSARFRDAGKPFAVEAGHRIYVDLTPLLADPGSRSRVLGLIGEMSEPAADGVRSLVEQRPEAFPSPGTWERFRSRVALARRLTSLDVGTVGRLLARFLGAFLRGPPDPERAQARIDAGAREVVDRMQAPESQADRVRRCFEMADLGIILPYIAAPSVPYLAAGALAGEALERLLPQASDDIETLGKGFDHEIATRINQRLGDLADRARREPALVEALEAGAGLDELAEVDGAEPFLDGFEAFLDDFGHRASSELDLSRPRWREDPAILLDTIRTTLAGRDPGAHRDHLERLKTEASQAAARVRDQADHGLLGGLRSWIVARLIETHRGGIQLREHHKHGAAHVFATTHDVLADAGEALAREGLIERAEDVWFLREAELLAALEEGQPPDADLDERRRLYERHASMTAPAVLTSEGETPTAIHSGDGSGALRGTPVSAGVVEGLARVVHDPAKQRLESGEILVAPSTDVGWTPLFQNAAGLVMEVGGRMTHGALVAREYGLPAVVSVAGATRRIETGDRLRIDGRQGTVEILEAEDTSGGDDGGA